MGDLVWIAVPHRLLDPETLPGPRLRRPAVLRIAVVPRLELGTLKKDYAALENWPATLLQDDLAFQVTVKTPDGIRPVTTPPHLFEPVAQPEIWAAIFRDDAAMVWAAPRAQEEVQFAEEDRYDDAYKVSETYRTASEILAQPDRRITDPDRRITDLEDLIRRWSTGPPAEEPPGPDLVEVAPDFRQTFGLLREHPEVLRDLGLVFELLVEGAELPGDNEPERYLSVGPADPTMVRMDVVSPWSAYEIDDHGFWPAARFDRQREIHWGEIHRGVIDLGGAERVDRIVDRAVTPRWAVATFDVDGAVTGLHAAYRQLAAAASGQETPLPALRSAGLMLIKPDRQQEYRERLQAAAGRATRRAGAGNADDHVYAEDLVLGYRVDVIDYGNELTKRKDATWRSLCQRTAAYWVEAEDGSQQEIASGRDHHEEGHVKHLPAVRGNDGKPHADEIVVRWDGWSLAVPPSRLGYEPEEPLERSPERRAPYRLSWQFDVPDGSLPRLRFGRRYRLRVRVADIAGGGPGLDGVPNDKRATNEVTYRRVEPVPPPRLNLVSSPLPGAAVDRLVIRSDSGMTAEEFVKANPRYAVTPDAGGSCTLHPPTAPFALIEQHGVLDSLTDEESYARAARALFPAEDDPPEVSLPDPAASGVAAYVAPALGGVAEPLFQAVTWGRWPSERTLRIVAGDRPTAGEPIAIKWVQLDDDEKAGPNISHELRVDLRQAEEAYVELSSTVQPSYLHHFMVLEWLGVTSSDGARPGTAGETLNAHDAITGRHPLLSPPAAIHVVHAVRRPLTDPVWKAPRTAHRTEGATMATVNAQFTPDGLDTDSTGRIEVAASWEDWDDEGSHPMTVDLVHDRDVDRGGRPGLQFHHEFPDTRHRDVTYTVKAISRFRQYFEPDEPAVAFETSTPQHPVVVPSSARPPAPHVLAVVPAFRWLMETDGDRIIRRRSGNRLVIELARPWFATGAGELLAVVTAATPPSSDLERLVTELAVDPVYPSPRIDRFPPATWFAATADGYDGQAPEVALPDLGETVSIAPHQVTLDHDRWQADIALNLPTTVSTYRPFIRLAVARYQPDSIGGLELSPVVTTEQVSLMPDREISVERDGQDLRVQVVGINPDQRNRIVITVEEGIDGPGEDPGGSGLIGVGGSGDVPAWRSLPEFTRTGHSSGGPIRVQLPHDLRTLRLSVREVEQLKPLGDAALPSDRLDQVPAELRERTVLFDHIPIPSDWL